MLKYWSGDRFKALQESFADSRMEILLQRFNLAVMADVHGGRTVSHCAAAIPALQCYQAETLSLPAKCQRQRTVMVKLFYVSIFWYINLSAFCSLCLLYVHIRWYMSPYRFIKSCFTVAFRCTPYNGK